MKKAEVVGLWSFNGGHETDLDNDKRLEFRGNATGTISGGDEVLVNFEWSIDPENNDILIGKSSLHSGVPIGKQELMGTGACLRIENLPLGEFLVLEFEKFSLPFGMRKFSKIT